MKISFDQGLPTVLYYFSADCGWCERNWANVDAARVATDGRYRFFGIAATGKVPSYMMAVSKPLTVITGVSSKARGALGFSGTPHTVLVAPGGHVIDSWVGAWDVEQTRAASAIFGTKLPGLAPRRPGQ